PANGARSLPSGTSRKTNASGRSVAWAEATGTRYGGRTIENAGRRPARAARRRSGPRRRSRSEEVGGRDVPPVEGSGDQTGSRRPAGRNVRGGAWAGGVRGQGLAPVPLAPSHRVDTDRGTPSASRLRPGRIEDSGSDGPRRGMAPDPPQRRCLALRLQAKRSHALLPSGLRR